MIEFLRKITKNRFVIFFVYLLIIFPLIQYIFFNTFSLPSNETKDLWFYSGIFMVLFSILFIEPYYTSPKNVITNTIPLTLVFLAIKNSFDNLVLWWVAIGFLTLLVVASIISLSLEDQNKSPDHWKNKFSRIMKNTVVLFGQGKFLYSGFFVYFLLTYYSIQNFYTLTLFILWAIILSINPKSIHSIFPTLSIRNDSNIVGEIFSVQSKKIFLAKIFDDKKNLGKFDLVKFKYSMQDSDDLVIHGIVFDTYLLNQEKWAKVLQLSDPKKDDDKFEKNAVYKISHIEEINKTNTELKVDNLVGVVIDDSTIGKIKFEYSKKKDDLQEGDLLELNTYGKRLFYQVISGTTDKERLDNDKNEAGFIKGEAIQLGEWQNDKLSFQKFGWVPPINTAVFKADTSDIVVDQFQYPLYKLGKIPSTSLPSVIDLHEAISHHIALLGVTGSGKSFLARELINQVKVDTKVICVDFNKEFTSTLSPTPGNIIDATNSSEIAQRIDWINNELEKFGNQQDKAQITTKQNEIKVILKSQIEAFLSNNAQNVCVFELPDVSNTTGILDYTRYFFRTIFEVAREKQIANTPVKICVVLEEAHTIVPEWNFSGSSDKAAQSLVNSIGQIALQGRKYGVGFVVIAQRTANVSKTVLTQCNTVICFQAFDETSFNFLGNYVGKDIVQTLPNLKRFHAIVAGKSIKSNIPLIIDLTR